MLPQVKLSGLFTAMCTPFRAGRLDEEGLRDNLRFQIRHDVDGVLILGTTGEHPTLSEAECIRVIEITVEEAKGRIHVMVGAGANSTEATIAEVERAHDLGADSVNIVAPYYNRPTQKGLFHHFEAICAKGLLPVCIYNIPSRTGVNIEPLTLREIATLPGVIGVKESSGNAVQMAEILHHLRGEEMAFSVLSGDDAMTLPLIALGGDGLVSVLSNLLPKEVGAMVRAALNNRWSEARDLYYELLPLIKAIFFETNPIPIKEAMTLCGMAAGPCRLPLTPMSEPHRASLERLLLDAGVIRMMAPVPR